MKDNKILLVTGASSDVGQALIRKVASNYTKVIAHYGHSSDAIKELASEFGDRIVPMQADFSSAADIDAMIACINEQNLMPDHVVHLVSPKAYNQKFDKDDIENFDIGWKVSVRSIVQILLSVMPYMKKQKYGKVIFMLTSCVLNLPAKYQSSYVTIKYALLGLMKSLSVEYADKGIAINAVSPDMIETKFLSEIPDLIVQKNAMSSPLGRNLTVNDVVPAYEYLLSDDGDAVRGGNLSITGVRSSR